MNKKYLMVFLYLLLAIPTSYSWNFRTHETFVENVYNSFPRNIQSNLNLTALKEGSTAPDNVFRDYRNHHYPPSYTKALFWLNKTKTSYNESNYNEASYSFGVASHYI